MGGARLRSMATVRDADGQYRYASDGPQERLSRALAGFEPEERSCLMTASAVRDLLEGFGGNAELYERLALKFLDDTHFAALEQALAGGDVDTAVREAHTLKGVAGNLSFAALYEAASKVNAALREGDLAGATALMDPVRSAHAAVVSALSSLRDAR